jgi:hypothetical protein
MRVAILKRRQNKMSLTLKANSLRELVNLSDHQIAVWSLVYSLIALVVSLVALVVSIYAIRRSNKNSSAATFVTLHEGLREGWRRFLKAETNNDKQYELSELLNLFELACAIHSERSLVGVSRELAGEYIRESWALLSANEDAKARIYAMLTTPETFSYMRKFFGKAELSSLLDPPTSPIPK